MINQKIKRILLVLTICLVSVLLYSCKSNKKDDSNSNTAYYESGLDFSNNSSIPVDSRIDYPSTGMRVRKDSSTQQDVEVYYGFSSMYPNIDNIIYDNETPTTYRYLYISNESDLNQQLKFTLYRRSSYSDSYQPYEKTTEVFTFTNSLDWFYNNESNFKFKKETNKYLDNIKSDDLIFGSRNECILYYYFEIKPVEGDTINFVAYTKTPQEIQAYEIEHGVPMPTEEYSFCDHPNMIRSYTNGIINVKKENDEISFSLPKIDGKINV